MANKWDLKTKCIQFTSATTAVTDLGSNLIPASKKRFITYIRAERVTALPVANASIPAGSIAIFSYTSDASASSKVSDQMTIADTVLRLRLGGATSGASLIGIPETAPGVEMPDRPDIEHPICAIAGGKAALLSVPDDAGPGMNVFVQYYDE